MNPALIIPLAGLAYVLVLMLALAKVAGRSDRKIENAARAGKLSVVDDERSAP